MAAERLIVTVTVGHQWSLLFDWPRAEVCGLLDQWETRRQIWPRSPRVQEVKYTGNTRATAPRLLHCPPQLDVLHSFYETCGKPTVSAVICRSPFSYADLMSLTILPLHYHHNLSPRKVANAYSIHCWWVHCWKFIVAHASFTWNIHWEDHKIKKCTDWFRYYC